MTDRTVGAAFALLGIALWAALLTGVLDVPGAAGGAEAIYGLIGAITVATGLAWYRNPPA